MRFGGKKRPALERAREALDAGDVKVAIRLGWEAGIGAARARNAHALEAARALALELRARSTGREHDDARSLAVYVDTALTQIQTGVRERSPLARLLSREPDVAMKVCPDCAESVQPAARICRFCGHTFAPPE